MYKSHIKHTLSVADDIVSTGYFTPNFYPECRCVHVDVFYFGELFIFI